jgi:phosphoribosylformylglycinamidine synthase subunit PurQ / glutaminase
VPKVAILVFPGTNCERDVQTVLIRLYKLQTELFWYTRSGLENYDAIIIPGGFTYGDRLRAGAIAAQSPIMKEIKRLARENVPILGICNGFQILVEAGLLPGALTTNSSLRFVCKWTEVKVINNTTPFTEYYRKGDKFDIPIAHGEGRFIVDTKTFDILKSEDRIVLVYSGENPNGSIKGVAGICNEQKNVVGVMPHPERGSESILTPTGRNNSFGIFSSLKAYCERKH